MYQVNGLYTIVVNGVQQFQSANPAAGIPNGTEITTDWLNDVQGELLNILQAAGIAQAQNQPTQLLQALRRLFGGNVEVLSGSNALSADQLGFIEIAGDSAGATWTQTFPSPAGILSPPLLVFNNTSVVQNIATPVGSFDGPGGSEAATMTIGAGQLLFLRADGANYVVKELIPSGVVTTSSLNGLLSAAGVVLESQFEQITAYYFAQSGSINNPAVNSFSTVISFNITFPSFSKTGAFRIQAQMVSAGTMNAANTRQNFQNVLFDDSPGGSFGHVGANSYVNALNAGDAFGFSDDVITYPTYAPGSTHTFNFDVKVSGGSTANTLTGCFIRAYVLEA